MRKIFEGGVGEYDDVDEYDDADEYDDDIDDDIDYYMGEDEMYAAT